jgi:phenylpropionate dioxygenase-like ring-hydroxylating dioxygenase large terminal subunit
MFLHDTHLPHVLAPSAYTSQEQFDREIQRLFQPAWHFAGSFAELPKDGDFLTTTILDHPLILWRKGGKYQAFLNVCPHRFSQLSSAPTGHCEPHLQCQYHGWEFDSEGCTRRIPDAPSFKPMSKGALALKKFRTESVGQILFVTLDDEAPPLREWLGPKPTKLIEEMFPPNYRLILNLDFEADANWKCRMENSLESYHLDMVHKATFGKVPPPETVIHELEPEWSAYFVTETRARTKLEERLDRLMHCLAGQEQDRVFRNYCRYPHIMFTKVRLFSTMEMVLPLTPTRTRFIYKFFCYENPNRWRSKLARHLLTQWARRFCPQVVKEDREAVGWMQKGLSSSRHPSEGVVSAREERCYHFQKYIHEETLPSQAELPERRLPCREGSSRDPWGG